jgi:protein ImuA
MSRQARLSAMRGALASLEPRAPERGALPFGDARIDGALPGGGLPLGRWHELTGEGLELETATAAAAIAALMAAPLADKGAVVWVMRRDDLYAPGLEGLGFPASRLIQVRARDEAQALAAFEDALATAGVAAVIGEAEDVDLTAGRRLQLACERRGATGFVVRRRPFGGRGKGAGGGSAAATRWKVACAPSEPEPGEPGLGASRWMLDLERCRGGRPGAWIVEQTDGPYPLRVVAELGDRHLAAPQPLRLAG